MERYGRVNALGGLNVRRAPGGDKVDLLDQGTPVRILEEVKFYKIEATGHGGGYVSAAYINDVVADEQEAHINSPVFELVQFEHPRFVGDPCRVDKDFVPVLLWIASIAEQCDLTLHITSSIRRLDNEIEGAVVKPATRSCHHVGHAIDMNIIYDGEFYNSKKLAMPVLTTLPSPVFSFIQSMRLNKNAKGVRWGGDFAEADPVHIDDNLYNRDQSLYMAKLMSRIDQAEAES